MNYTRQEQSLQSNFIYGFNVLDDDDDTNNVIFTRSKSIARNASTVPVKF